MTWSKPLASAAGAAEIRAASVARRPAKTSASPTVALSRGVGIAARTIGIEAAANGTRPGARRLSVQKCTGRIGETQVVGH